MKHLRERYSLLYNLGNVDTSQVHMARVILMSLGCRDMRISTEVFLDFTALIFADKYEILGIHFFFFFFNSLFTSRYTSRSSSVVCIFFGLLGHILCRGLPNALFSLLLPGLEPRQWQCQHGVPTP